MNQMIMLDEGGSRVATPVDIIRQARRVSGMAFPQPMRLGSEEDLVTFARYRFALLQEPALLVARLNKQAEVIEYFTGLMGDVQTIVRLLRSARLALRTDERLAVVHALPPRMVGRMAQPDKLGAILHEQAVALDEIEPLYVRAVIADELPQPSFTARPGLTTPIEVDVSSGRRAATHEELVQALYQLNVRRLERGQMLCCSAHSKDVLQTCLDSFDDPSTGLMLVDEHSRFISYHHLCYGMMESVGHYLNNVLHKVRDPAVHHAVLVRYKPQLHPQLESAEQEVAETIFTLLNVPRVKAFTCMTIGVDGVSLYDSPSFAPSVPMVAILVRVGTLH